MLNKSIRSRLFASYLAIVLLGMGLASLLVWRLVEQQYLAVETENLLTQAQVYAGSITPADLAEFSLGGYSQTSNVMPGIHTRVLTSNGGVAILYPFAQDMVAAPPAEQSTAITVADLSARVEIKQALSGRASSAIRVVSGRRVLYAAAPVTAADGQVTGLVYLAMPLPAGGLPPSLLLQLGGVVLGVVLLALALGWIISAWLASPLEATARAAEAVSAGDLNLQVPVSHRFAEMEQLGLSFNRMTAHLREADQAKNAFIADVTHELRTPLTVIKGTVETLEDGAVDDLTGRGALLESMQLETDRLIRLVNDLLVLTRADAGKLDLRLQPVDLAALAAARCEVFSRMAVEKHLTIQATGGESAPVLVMGDEDRLIQILDNLLGNAIRYCREGGRVEVRLSRGEGSVVCSVSDQGSGIDADHLPHIFDRFYRVESSRDRQSGGAGLGLAIVKALVAAQGGQITARSQPGEGTEIIFSLPSAN
jgi:signal transduction histidine kinase